MARLVGLVLLLVAIGFSARLTAFAQDSAYQQIIEDSKTETDGLLIYSSIADDTWEPLVEAFNKKYPWIEVTTIEDTNYGVFETYYDEIDAGDDSADILVSTDISEWKGLILGGEHQQYVSIEEKNLPDFAKDENHLYLLTSNPLLMIWNKKLVSTPPKTLEGLVKLVESDPKGYENQVTTFDVGRSVNGFYSYWFYLQDKGEPGWKLLERLGKTKPKTLVTSEQIVDELLEGKSKIGFFVEASAIIPHLAGKTDLGWTPIQDGMVILEYVMGITQNATSPNSAKLFIDFALSAAGQTILAESGLPAYRDDLYGKVELHEDQFFEGVDEDNQIYFDGDAVPADEDAQEAFIERWKKTFQIK